MKRYALFQLGFLMLTLTLNPAFAQSKSQGWISDQLQTSLSDTPQSSGKYLGSLTAGSAVEILQTSADGRYVQVRAGDMQGWVWAKNVMTSPSIHSQFAQQSQSLAALEQKNHELQQGNEKGQSSIQALQQALAQSREQAETARADLLALQRVSANAVEIDRRNRELQARVVALEHENLQLQHQNSRLQDTGMRQQMLLGGGLVLSGAFLSVVFSLLGRTKRRRQLGDL